MPPGPPGKVAVVIPCYRATGTVRDVVIQSLENADAVFCVDDACPDGTGDVVASMDDPRLRLLRHERNLGVGGAVKTGYRAALDEGFEVIVKIDSDGQMDPGLIPMFVTPLLEHRADYCKGNRFFELEYLKGMPLSRLFGNGLLSFFSKFSSGYWRLLDPTNGYTAIHAAALRALPLDKVDDRYFFESDMLFRLNIARAVVLDVPMRARYGDERSNMRIHRVIAPFLAGHAKNICKRIFYTYFLRDFNIASLQLIVGFLLTLFGLVFGLNAWHSSLESGSPASAGTVMLAGLPSLIGVQLLLSFLNFDIQNTPAQAISSFRARTSGD